LPKITIVAQFGVLVVDALQQPIERSREYLIASWLLLSTKRRPRLHGGTLVT